MQDFDVNQKKIDESKVEEEQCSILLFTKLDIQIIGNVKNVF